MLVNLDNVDNLYADLKNKIVFRKEEFAGFINFLESKTTWLTSPASTRYHLACEKGLLMHSVGVAYQFLTLKSCLMPSLEDESCIICGLFHDVGKLGSPEHPLYKKGFGDYEGYYYNPDSVAMGLGVRSLYLATQHITLSDDETQAICCHDGQYIKENEIVAHKEAPLTLLLHYADYWQAHMYEDKKRYTKYFMGATSK